MAIIKALLDRITTLVFPLDTKMHYRDGQLARGSISMPTPTYTWGLVLVLHYCSCKEENTGILELQGLSFFTIQAKVYPIIE
jgi:hypothetical protein